MLLRSLLLLGILSFAGLNAARDLLAWWQGDTPEAIATGPVGWYGLLGGLSCGALAWAQHRGWVSGGRCSELLRTESRAALRETAGAACEQELIQRTRCGVQSLVEPAAAQLLDLWVVKLGRISCVVAYVNPARAVEASWLDNLRAQLEASCTGLLGPVRAEVVITGRPPFSGAVAAD